MKSEICQIDHSKFGVKWTQRQFETHRFFCGYHLDICVSCWL